MSERKNDMLGWTARQAVRRLRIEEALAELERAQRVRQQDENAAELSKK